MNMIILLLGVAVVMVVSAKQIWSALSQGITAMQDNQEVEFDRD